MTRRFTALLSTFLAIGTALRAQQPPAVFRSPSDRPAAPATTPIERQASGLKPRTPVSQPNQVCRTVTFYGVRDQIQIPTFNGISSTWVGGVSQPELGGQAYFYNEPSRTGYAAVLVTNEVNTITFASPVASVSFYYATGFNSTVTAYDSSNNPLAEQAAPANWTVQNGNYYSVWTQIPALTTSTNQISSVNIDVPPNGLNGFFGIDLLQYCTVTGIDSVEMTQAIQQLQPLQQLVTALDNGTGPPVPIIAGKWGVMRVYMKEVLEAAQEYVGLSIPGIITLTKPVSLVPGCTTMIQRYQGPTCSSTDFYFKPPAGAWTATLTLTDASGNQVEQDTLPFYGQTTKPLSLTVVEVCDSVQPGTLYNTNLCGSTSSVVSNTALLAKLAPTATFTPNVKHRLFPRRPVYVDNPYTYLYLPISWWQQTVKEIGRLYHEDVAAGQVSSSPYTVYFGAVRPVPIPNGQAADIASALGGLADIGSHQAAALSTDMEFETPLTDVTAGTIAHETGHALGLTHTNSNNPLNRDSPPGCWGFAPAVPKGATAPISTYTDWPWPGTQGIKNSGSNLIQSTNGLEVPFDVNLQTALNPSQTFEIESYCHPRWISPQRYVDEFYTLAAIGSSSPTAPQVRSPEPHTASPQPFWMITGTIPSSGPAQFDPLFQYTVAGDTSGGSGAYSLQVLDAKANVLFTQHFDLPTENGEEDGVPPESSTTFSQLVPVMAGAVRIVLLNPNSVLLTYLDLGGVAPTVTITSPTAAFDGSQAITWTIADPDSVDFTSRIYYSPNNGATWEEIAQLPDSVTSMVGNFSELPGTNGAQGLIQILVSDGVNTGQATSPNFSIAKQVPSLVQINSPTPNFSQKAIDPVLLTGTAYDVDDGVLSGAALSWSSNLQGALGTGSPLSVNLQPGVHTITLTATDSDNNSISTSTIVTIGGAPPTIKVTFNTITSPPVSADACIQPTVSASAGANGAPLSAVQYSLDGGNTYTNIPLPQLPFTFVIPGTGFIDMVFSAMDASGQLVEETGTFFNMSACGSLTVPNVVGMTQANATTALTNASLTVGATTAAASTTVAAGSVISQNPVSGAPLAAGTSDSVNLTISSGPSVAVPNVVGQAQGNAGITITGAGLTVGTVSQAASATVASGNVISETPSAGTSAAAGSAVNLVVSTGTGLAISAPAALPTATAGYGYSVVLTPSGGSGNYTWSATGLPSTLAIDNTGTISGTPSSNTGSPFSVQVTLTDASNSTTTSRTYSLAVNPTLSITATALPNATVGASYTATTMKATGGSGTYNWSAGNLPPGMVIGSATGTISGTPTSNTGSPLSVVVTVEDSTLTLASATYNLAVNLAPLGISGPPSLPGGIAGVPYTATVTATGGSGNYSWSATGLPQGLTIAPYSGTISGTPASAAGSPYSVTVTVADGNTTTNYAYSLAISAPAGCNITQDQTTSAADVQREINEAAGSVAPYNDMNADGIVNVVDVEIVINAALGGVCWAR
jgi:hypothetical protein